MSDTPMSDAMAVHAETKTGESYDRFVELFRTSVVGVAIEGMPTPDQDGNLVADGDLSVHSSTHGDGRSRILAYADPEVFLVNFGPRFNAGMRGEVLLGMAASDPDCAGILVNSATQEISLVIAKPLPQN
jgi:hypothetical protein